VCACELTDSNSSLMSTLLAAGYSGVARGGVWGVQTPPIENRCVFYGLIIDKKTFKLAFVQNQST